MGKVKSKRNVYHNKAAKMESATASAKEETRMPVDTVPKVDLPSDGGIFSSLNIDIDALTKQLPGKGADDDDAKSAVTSKSMRGLNMKKKDKMKLRKEIFMKKIDRIQHAKKEAKAKKRRQQTAVVGDMKPLGDTLPTLDLLLRDLDKPQEKVTSVKGDSSCKKKKAIKKKGTRRKEMLEDLNVFQQVLVHPAFKENPLATISEHLQNKMKQEEEMDT